MWSLEGAELKEFKRVLEKSDNPLYKEIKLAPVNFNNEIVITTKTLAQVYETEEHNITKNFNQNKDKFKEGKHYYKLEGAQLKDFKRVITKSDNPLYQEIKFASVLTLWTKRGASRHCKMLGTDKKSDTPFDTPFDTLNDSPTNPALDPANTL